MEILVTGIICFVVGLLCGFMIFGLMVFSGNQNKCAECRENREFLQEIRDEQASKEKTNKNEE